MLPKRLKDYQCYIHRKAYLAAGCDVSRAKEIESYYKAEKKAEKKAQRQQMWSSIFTGLFAGAAAVASAAIQSSGSSGTAASVSTLAKAQQDSASCSSQISAKCAAIKSKYGISVNEQDGSYTGSIEQQKQSIEKQIEDLKAKYPDETKGSEGTSDSNGDLHRSYAEAKTNVANLETAVEQCSNYDNQLASFNTSACPNGTSKAYIKVSNGIATAQTFTESDFAQLYAVKNKVAKNDSDETYTKASDDTPAYDTAKAQQAAANANAKASENANQYNTIAHNKQELLSQNKAKDTNELSSNLQKARSKLNEVGNKELSSSDSSSSEKMTVAQYESQLSKLEQQKESLENGQTDFDNSIKEIKDLIARKKEADNVISEYNDIADAQQGKKNAKGKMARNEAKQNIALQKTQYFNAANLYEQKYYTKTKDA